MTDNEIIKGYCRKKLCPPAQEIINRQKAEIEQYKENEKFISVNCDLIQEKLLLLMKTQIPEAIESAKSEAIKEFAKKYKDHINSFTGMFSPELGFVVSLDAVLYAVDFISGKILGRNGE